MNIKTAFLLLLFNSLLNAQNNALFVSNNGNDDSNGSIDNPLKTIAKANMIASTSTNYKYIKLRSGDVFSEELTAESNKYYTSYGSGQAIVMSYDNAVYVRTKSQVVIDNIRFDGRILVRDADSLVIKDCNIYGVSNSRNNIAGIQIQGILLDEIRVERCTVKNFAEGLRVYPVYQSDVNDMDSLIIDACYIDSCYRDDDNYDGIRVIGNMNANSIDYGYKAIIRNCEVKNWSEDAIDLAYASNVIVERNFLHDNKFPNNYDFESTGIKIGEQNASTSFKGSTGNIIRYNKIYNINRPTHLPTDIAKGINASRTNDALIHHNLVYNVAGVGFYQNGLNTVDVDPSYHIKFFNNTVSVDSNCFLTASGGSNVRSYVKNNVFVVKGKLNAIFVLEDTRIGKNVFINRGGVYEGNTPTRTSVAVWQKYGDIDSSSSSYYGVDSTSLFPGGGDYKITNSNYTGEGLNLGYDIEGNAVDATNPDCGAYEYDAGGILINSTGLKLLLEAPYGGGRMNAEFSSSNLLPTQQPYNTSPWNINDNSSISSLDTTFVDWVLVQLRADSSTTSYSKPGILTSNGFVVNTDGSPFRFSSISSGEYYIVIRHRNHLDIMSSGKVFVQNNNKILYDFTTGLDKIWGTNSMAEVESGKFAMIAGDGDANGVVNVLDFSTVANNILFYGYSQGDIDMNGVINVLDYAFISRNTFKASQVP